MEWLQNLFLWIILPLLNFLAWKYYGFNYSASSFDSISQFSCPPSITSSLTNLQQQLQQDEPIESGPLEFNYSYCKIYQQKLLQQNSKQEFHQPILFTNSSYRYITEFSSDQFEKFKGLELAKLKSPSPTLLLSSNPSPSKSCQTYVEVASSIKSNVKSCVGILWSSTLQSTPYLQRFNSDQKKTGRMLDLIHPKTSGIFRNVAKKKGRNALAEKLNSLFRHLDESEELWKKLLSARGIYPGDDVVLMVLNDGEYDLFLNFACSCRNHGLSLHHMMVICASPEIVAMVRATGALGYYDPFFGKADKRASSGYLDKIFVEMMWYKAFSVWLGLKLGYNILFQDVDLVWFKNPFEYFQQHHNITTPTSSSSSSSTATTTKQYTAYFSDDGQRSLRYTPFYANSGFYYLKSTLKNIYFAYSIVTAFDSLQATGSHQNVFTSRLMELMDLSESHQLFLSLEDFPSGVKYHHDANFMNKMMTKQHTPFIFHMCWTANKKQKLENFMKAKMWYINNDKCGVTQLIPPQGQVYRQTVSRIGTGSGINHLQKLTSKDTFKMFGPLATTCCVKKDVL